MNQYHSLLILNYQQRADELITSIRSYNVPQKQVAKILAAMVSGGDCKPGDMKKHAEMITGLDIRKTLQNVYELTNVLRAVIGEEIEITLAEFDSLDASKLALLSPFLSKEELKPLLAEAVNAAKTGTAKNIRDLKGSGETYESKTVKELREKLKHSEARAKAAEDRLSGMLFRMTEGQAGNPP